MCRSKLEKDNNIQVNTCARPCNFNHRNKCKPMRIIVSERIVSMTQPAIRGAHYNEYTIIVRDEFFFFFRDNTMHTHENEPMKQPSRMNLVYLLAFVCRRIHSQMKETNNATLSESVNEQREKKTKRKIRKCKVT